MFWITALIFDSLLSGAYVSYIPKYVEDLQTQCPMKYCIVTKLVSKNKISNHEQYYKSELHLQ